MNGELKPRSAQLTIEDASRDQDDESLEVKKPFGAGDFHRPRLKMPCAGTSVVRGTLPVRVGSGDQSGGSILVFKTSAKGTGPVVDRAFAQEEITANSTARKYNPTRISEMTTSCINESSLGVISP